MKLYFLLVLSLISLVGLSQSLSGAWKLVKHNNTPVSDECIKIMGDGYFMVGVYDSKGAFKQAEGGAYSYSKGKLTENLDFHTMDSSQVRQPRTLNVSVKKEELTVEGKAGGEAIKQVWQKIDEPDSRLKGVWRFGARVNDEGVAGERRGGSSPRQTIKILSGKYFQWAAFNYETKQFMGTGGGIYTLADGKYTESIQFFSRDNSRTGMSLTFDCRLEGTDWYHKGKGTTGNPVSEVWEKIK